MTVIVWECPKCHRQELQLRTTEISKKYFPNDYKKAVEELERLDNEEGILGRI